jgi:hypothetical protein
MAASVISFRRQPTIGKDIEEPARHGLGIDGLVVVFREFPDAAFRSGSALPGKKFL